ncbi:MAG: hemerythrin family protein [Campylobacteraceae bacterium]|nr:hemerythrin family protein [Campylobacteraceae bacterium]
MASKWNNKYSLHIEKIDNQHKELFRLSAIVESLNKQTTKEEIKKLFNSFFNYMRNHFRDEEAYMNSINYPLLKQHHKLHSEIIEEFTKLIKENHSLESLKEQMKIATKKWLINHIMENDLKIEKWRLANS